MTRQALLGAVEQALARAEHPGEAAARIVRAVDGAFPHDADDGPGPAA